MKKRIVALVSALTLVFAMSMSAMAAESISADDVKDIVTEVGAENVSFPTDLEVSKNVAGELLETADAQITTLTDETAVKELATAAKKALDSSSVESVKVVAVFELTSKSNEVSFKLDVKANEKAYALHVTENGVEKILGSIVDGKVTFKFSSFSPVAIIIETEKAASTDQPPYNPAWDPANNNASAAGAGAVAVAPKTGDVVMMVSIMAIIFMAGAAVAVVMSKKRA